ncbi:hypothetical protein [Aeoliella sp.]|uniref:hypothetical protein n=1 Tax=Aeoliella sp. TaxID=2795800 RepID=UPI003CCBB6D9
MLANFAQMAFAACLVCASMGTPVEAQEFGAFEILNPTSNTMKYQVRWGEGDWQTYSIPPGYSRWHAYELDLLGIAPAPEIRFDWVGGDSSVTHLYYDLDFFTTFDPKIGGKPYRFQYFPDGVHVDLYPA